ncbi:FliH/SctL family protein [Marinomonas mediterranea]|jgi:Flagellar assembly protein FliH.|uniref:Flagellar assembly protein FliH n=1 Tax=Marinomonas mediterranea (strain ATCC 700492 / JCM 21426 / NBRC 103028 / MMB-1) TaxID=717774 RepID=F2K3L3_MARM1|nr:FliH/SctL family protein [Marinomonas mediterranea]ADZ92452.1 Flagellar assembly protein FliH/Type III secretion system HrpE [Marinomonas mediterranea MMB-1]WCN10402.1 flagellar assembly protein FliH [Marinomonas mediterranea]WCN14448.1 flagellar assembly protein FliH [Marinomonas mediterranea]WCN18500.1 flagellar assembly protein FliH [Marinomonas mediterranea MMB-1]
MTENGPGKDKKLTAYERWELPNLDSDTKEQTSIRETALHIKEENAPVVEEIEEESLVYEPLTASQLEEIRSAAYDEGFIQGESDGYAKGHSEGVEAGKSEGFEHGKEEGMKEGVELGKAETIEQGSVLLQQVENTLNQAYQELIKPLESSRTELEAMLYKSVQSLVEAICERELSVHSQDMLTKGLSQALDSIGEYEGKVKLTVNPSDREALETVGALDRLNIQIDTDEGMLEGGFVLNSNSFFVDGTVESKLSSVFEQLNIPSE